MGICRIHLLVSNLKQMIQLNNKHQPDVPRGDVPRGDVPRGHLAVYVGEIQKKRFVVPLSYLNQPLFQDLLRRSEEEYDFNYPTGGLTIPCHEEAFIKLTSRLPN